MHAETGSSDPAAVRWVIPEAELPCGRLLSAPGDLGRLLAGPIREAFVEPHGVSVWLRDGEAWRDWGTTVQQAIAEAHPAGDTWQVSDEDEVLAFIVRDVLAGSAGDYIRSHGGVVTLVAAYDGRVEIEFSGACAHCPATGETLHSRIEHAVRERYPRLAGITDSTDRRRRRWR